MAIYSALAIDGWLVIAYADPYPIPRDEYVPGVAKSAGTVLNHRKMLLHGVGFESFVQPQESITSCIGAAVRPSYLSPKHAQLAILEWQVYRLCLPLWLPLALFSIAPLFAVTTATYRRVRRNRKGLCLNCGYDLRAAESAQCPECGQSRNTCCMTTPPH